MTKLLAMPGEGERLDRFELVAEIAQGGMATVYLARLVGVGGFKRFVAIKRLHPHLAQEQEFIEMFLDEARIAARIHHPNVVPILEIGEHNHQYYLVMEYIEGDTAGRLVARAAHRQQRLPPAITARIMLDTLTGLHAAHELRDDNGQLLQVVHRDVSPQNILVGVDGVGRITDFGVARAAARLTSTRGGQVKGKLAYLSPEQVRGIEVDRRADVFAAGIVMWELFTSERLFKGEADADTLFRIVAAEVPSMRAIHPQVPPAVEAVCLKALARDPKDRWQTAQDFAEALENAGRANNCLSNIRETTAFVNEILGQDISAQRDIVRAWLARSESRSGVAQSMAGMVSGAKPPTKPADGSGSRERVQPPRPGQPQAPAQQQSPQQQAPVQYQAPQQQAPRPPQMSVPTSREMQPPAMQLTSLEDDDEDIATRVDSPLLEQEAAKSMPAMPVPQFQGQIQPQIHIAPAAGRPGSSLNTTQPFPEGFQPAPAPMPPAFATQAQSQSPYGVPSPYGPQNPAAQQAPYGAPTPPTTSAPVGGSKLPMWTLAIPAVIIAIALIVLAVRLMQQSSDGPVNGTAPTVSAPNTSTANTTPTNAATTSTSTAQTPNATAVPTNTTPTITLTATTPPTNDTTPTSNNSTPTTTPPTNNGTPTTPPTNNSTPTTRTTGPKPLQTSKPVIKKPVVDNPDFGGRR